MQKARISTGLLALTFILVVGFMPGDVRQKQAAAAPQPFDHSDCQYPDRWSNPADGCDNSDPAVPECIKSAYSQEAEASCIALVVKDYEDRQKQAETPAATVTPAPATEPVLGCEVK